MAKYTFSTPCTKDIYTLVGSGVTEGTFIFSTNGRIIIQDSADADPLENAIGWMPVASDRPYNFLLTGLKIFYRPWSVDSTVNGIKK